MIQDLDFDKDGSISEDEFIEVNILCINIFVYFVSNLLF